MPTEGRFTEAPLHRELSEFGVSSPPSLGAVCSPRDESVRLAEKTPFLGFRSARSVAPFGASILRVVTRSSADAALRALFHRTSDAFLRSPFPDSQSAIRIRPVH